MKVVYFMPEMACVSGPGNGVRKQAIIWAEGLKKIGVNVSLLGPWDNYDFKDCDIVHIFSYFANMETSINSIKKKFRCKVVVSPIIDTNRSPFLTKMASYCHIPLLHMYSLAGSLRESAKCVEGWFVRSEYEGNHLSKALGINKIYKVMLPARIVSHTQVKKEDFCLHVAYLPDGRKNVFRLIEAAIKYKFKLVLAGSKYNEIAWQKMMRMVNGHDNIKVLGWVSDEQLKDLYSRARVFALPSLAEGVGLVALEAAAYGCDIVLTNRGAPKEYYNGMAKLVDPLSVDEIGLAVQSYLNGVTKQPDLQDYIKKNHSVEASVSELYNAYEEVLNGKF